MRWRRSARDLRRRTLAPSALLLIFFAFSAVAAQTLPLLLPGPDGKLHPADFGDPVAIDLTDYRRALAGEALCPDRVRWEEKLIAIGHHENSIRRKLGAGSTVRGLRHLSEEDLTILCRELLVANPNTMHFYGLISLREAAPSGWFKTLSWELPDDAELQVLFSANRERDPFVARRLELHLAPVAPEEIGGGHSQILFRPGDPRITWDISSNRVTVAEAGDDPRPAPSSLARVPSPWNALAEGLELGRFKADRYTPKSDSLVTVLRIDPGRWNLRMVSSADDEQGENRTARGWCAEAGGVAATNAGMFATDYSTHVGYMRCEDRVYSAGVNKYQSVAAMEARATSLPPFRMLDLDVVDLKECLENYRCVVQNLRLIKRSHENRWSPQPKMWSEAALGEDADGNILFIFCRSPYSMHDFNEVLLSLPLELECAQHLEGGPEAQLYLNCAGTELELVGSYETDFFESDSNTNAYEIPNAFVITPR